MKKSFALLATTIAVLAFPGIASATTLTFDVAGGITNFQNIPQNYGDNVAATPQAGHAYGAGTEGFTPNVTVSYGTLGEAPALWTAGYGDLSNVHFNDADGDTTLTVNFLGAAGYTADLYGFDMASFLTTGQTIRGLKVIDATTNSVLFSQGSTFITGTTRNSFNFNGPLSANNLSLIVDLTGLGGASDDIGIDNIRFGETGTIANGVPEPATWAMMIAGFGLVGGAMRRRDVRVLA